MARWRIERSPAPVWVRPLIPLLAIIGTFLLTSVLLVLAKADPFTAFLNFLVAPLSNEVSAIEVLVKSTPLLFTGAAVTFAFAAGYWNIGAEGQLYAGAIAAAAMGIAVKGLPPIVAILLMIVAGFVGGVAWALIPVVLKIKLAVDEVVTTLLMNSIILFIVSFLLNGVWRDPVSGWPQSPTIADEAILPKLIPQSRLHLGFILAWVVIGIVYLVIRRSALGLRMRSIGLNPEAARFAGVNVNKTILIAALVSGGIAGLAGMSEIAGIQFHLIDSISPGYGYTGIIAATLGGLNPLGVSIASIFIGLIETGAQSVSRAMGIPIYLGNVVEATLLLVTLGMIIIQNYRIRRA
jgi:general nucleoside transport system permease protein